MKTYRSASLAAFDDKINHAFFTRNGGIGTGLYENLNVSLASNDDKTVLTENRRRCAEHLGVSAERLVTLAQCHSDIVLTITDASSLPLQSPADALVTYLPGVALGIQTADCAPILFYAPKSGVIGAAHAGWQGAFKDIHIRTVEAMEKLGAEPSDIIAAIGPCLHSESFEVGEEFHADFIAKDSYNSRYFQTVNKRLYFDNAGFISAGLNNIGVIMTETMPHNTYTEEKDFFSFRRAAHHDEPDYGRQLSAIMLK